MNKTETNLFLLDPLDRFMYILLVGLYAYLIYFVVYNLLGYINAVHRTFPIYVFVVQMTHTRTCEPYELSVRVRACLDQCYLDRTCQLSFRFES